MSRKPPTRKPTIPKLAPTLPHHEQIVPPLQGLLSLGEEEDYLVYSAVMEYLEPFSPEEATQQLLQIALDPTWLDYVDFDNYPEDLDPFEHDPRLSTPIHAIRLLANMEVRSYSAIEPLALLLSSPDEAIAEEVSYFYAAMGDEALPFITALLLSPESAPAQRVSIGAALQAMVEIDSEKLETSKALLIRALEQEEDTDTATCFVAFLVDFGDASALPAIEKAYEQERIDTSLLPLNEVRDILNGTPIEQTSVIGGTLSEIEDAIEATEEKQVPFVASAKVGRNDACPCGSGKKYKKCCGA